MGNFESTLLEVSDRSAPRHSVFTFKDPLGFKSKTEKNAPWLRKATIFKHDPYILQNNVLSSGKLLYHGLAHWQWASKQPAPDPSTFCSSGDGILLKEDQ